ncbi:MAG: NUDIX hydrolase [Nitrospirae bacterium]|nr:MAG: NUDIX hydrolase [Nitrospirota bacterium]
MKPRILNSTTVWKGNFLKLKRLELLNSSGRPFYWEVVQRVGTKGIVAVVPFTDDGQVLLIKQYRPPVDSYVVEFPAGLNDRDEPLEEVAKRELLEETGYRAERVEFLIRGPLSSGASSEILTVFTAFSVKPSGPQRLDEVEEIEVIKLPVEGFMKKLLKLQSEDTYIDLKIPGLFELALTRWYGNEH